MLMCKVVSSSHGITIHISLDCLILTLQRRYHTARSR